MRALFLSAAILPVLAQAQSFDWVDDLTGTTGLFVTGISRDGSTLVGSSQYNGAWRYRRGGLELLSHDHVSSNSFASASDVSADGSVVVGSILTSSGNVGCSWNDVGQRADYPTLPGDPGYPYRDAYLSAVSGDGKAFVGLTQTGEQGFAGTLYNPTGHYITGSASFNQLTAISDDGNGYAGHEYIGVASGGYRALWEGPNAGDFSATPTGGVGYTIWGMSAHGATVVGCFGQGGFVWTAGGDIQYVTAPPEAPEGRLFFGPVDSTGTVVGGTSQRSVERAILYSKEFGVMDATTLVLYEGFEAKLDGRTLVSVDDLTVLPDGRVRFVGQASDPSGWTSYIATVTPRSTPYPVPEPASFAALGLGTAALVRRRKRA